MTELIIACVRTGMRFEFGWVTDLRNSVARHLPRAHTMVCLTDMPERCTDVAFVDISAIGLRGSWAKMALFEPAWRGTSKVIYFDLNTAIMDDISLLADVPGEFSICKNTEQRSLRKYDSAVMVIGGGMGDFIWQAFERRRDVLLMRHARHGTAACLEELYPTATFLQRLMPKEFFRNHVSTQ